ncbi:tetratricopeptide repeat protein [Hazenella coriacea]|uniref:Tetratricopeptide repeat protein n=1 Tax=Hazenella coriacea TaxID=1179467 RepID=A0A4V2UUS2_9BACL|nr:tetratricopeptide repeat protein [Hazenella coriacea]TCS92608.1 hypothetical protein EDD58_11172 [Hazenella coriacea]
MKAWDVVDLRLDPSVDKETVDNLVNHYTTLYQRSSDPSIVARAAINLGFALAFVPSTIFSEVLELIKEGLRGLTDLFERARIHYEFGQLLTRTRKSVFFELAREHYHIALTELKQANVEYSTIGAAILNGLALLSYFEDRFDEALELEQQAFLSLSRLPETPEVWQQRVLTALHIGDVYRKRLSEYNNAQYFYQKALYYAKQTGNPSDITLVHKALQSVEEFKKSKV